MELHVYPSALPSLPSTTAECNAAIALLFNLLPPEQYTIIEAFDPSTSPTGDPPILSLPSEAKSRSQMTVVAGFTAISHHFLSSQLPSTQEKSPSSTPNHYALTTHIITHATPLISTALYADPHNHEHYIRPLLSKAFPFPFNFLLPSRWHDVGLNRAESLGLRFATSPDALDDEEDSREGRRENKAKQANREAESQLASSFLIRELRDMNERRRQTLAQLARKEALRERMRLQGVVERLCEPVEGVLRGLEKGYSSGDKERFGPYADAVVLGYFAPLLYLPLPRCWTRDVIRDKFPRVAEYVDGLRDKCPFFALQASDEKAKSINATDASPTHQPIILEAASPSLLRRISLSATLVLDHIFPASTRYSLRLFFRPLDIYLTSLLHPSKPCYLPNGTLAFPLFTTLFIAVGVGSTMYAVLHIISNHFPQLRRLPVVGGAFRWIAEVIIGRARKNRGVHVFSAMREREVR